MKMVFAFILSLLFVACNRSSSENDAAVKLLSSPGPKEDPPIMKRIDHYTDAPVLKVESIVWNEKSDRWEGEAFLTNTTSQTLSISTQKGPRLKGVVEVQRLVILYEVKTNNGWTIINPQSDTYPYFQRALESGEQIQFKVVFPPGHGFANPDFKPGFEYRIVYNGVLSSSFTLPEAR